MTEYVRVKDKSTGHKLSVIKSTVDADQAGESPAFQVLKQDAVDVGGNPLPPEYAEPDNTSGQSATTTPKEK